MEWPRNDKRGARSLMGGEGGERPLVRLRCRPRYNGRMTPIYLDYNATTPLDPAVVEAMLPFLREHFGTPSSTHAFGQVAAQAVAGARQQVAELLGAQPDEIVFTSGGSEASNQAIKGAVF